MSTDPDAAGELIDGSPPRPSKKAKSSLCEPDREFIEAAVRDGRNAVAIYQDLVTYHGFKARYASVRRFVRKLRGSSVVEACAVIQTAPGEEAQVDYATGPMVRDPKAGKYRRTRLFVMPLGYSRKAVRLLTFQSSIRGKYQDTHTLKGANATPTRRPNSRTSVF